ncbi:terminase small subunit [Paenibacillus sp. 2RAB27]|uniref:terminase small subunit n=1 Tax=Paenibacillus sp. 2RAB27 TaxID=3232991 RepID=UPI003F9AB13C
MPRQRDPKRDEAFKIYKDSGGNINLNAIAAQLGVGDGTVRGWKAKDNWDNNTKHGAETTEKPVEQVEDEEEQDELFLQAVQIVIEAKQASTSLLQRRLRCGYTRAARLIDAMEKRGFIGPYSGDKPREVIIKAFDMVPKVTERKERNATKETERPPIRTERSNIVKNAPIPVIEQPEIENDEPDDDGLTIKKRIFIGEYLRDFNATRAAMAAGYSKKTAYSIGWELLRKPEVQVAIKKYTESIMSDVGLNAQRILMEYMKIAFADITDFIEFGQEEHIARNKKGEIQLDENGDPVKYKINFTNFKDGAEIDGTLISEVKQSKEGVSVKLYDKTKALEVLVKYIDLLPDKHKRMIEEEKLKISRERLEIDRDKGEGGDSDSGNIDQLTEMIRLSAEAAAKARSAE